MPVRTLRSFWRCHGAPARVGVAFSGGSDSLALLRAFAELQKKEQVDVVALHVNHALRAEADRDERFCREQARALGIETLVALLDPATFAGNRHDAARKARYAALARLAQERELSAVFTGHTLDDQAETVLFRMIRGTGPAGLQAIREQNGIFLRPWLHLRRGELQSFLRACDLDWLRDPSNVDDRYSRTQIRERLLPVIEDIGGAAAIEAIGRLAELASVERTVLDEVAAADLAACRTGDSLAIDVLSALFAPRRTLVLRRWLAEKGIVPPRKVIEDLDHLVTAPGPAGPVSLPTGVKITRDYKKLNWGGAPVVYKVWDSFAAARPGTWSFADGRLVLTATDSPGDDERAVAVPADVMRTAYWRPPWPGARIAPTGMAGHVKCAELFVNEKVPRELRSVWPLLVRDGRVLLVPGLRSDKALKSQQENDKTWAVRLEWLW